MFEIAGWRPKEIRYDLSKPQGVASRAADITRAIGTLGWEPRISYREGFERTMEWYFTNKSRENVKVNLEKLLSER